MSSLSTHVLDASLGDPATGVAATLTGADGTVLEQAATDADGRIAWSVDLAAGTHRLELVTGPYFADDGREAFHPTIVITFEVAPDRPHTHVALLVSPFAYTTYRGS